MDEEFLLPVTCNGKEFEFPVRLLKYGYTFTLELDIEGTKIIYERDEERNWRAVMPYGEIAVNKKINADLLKATSKAIEAIIG